MTIFDIFLLGGIKNHLFIFCDKKDEYRIKEIRSGFEIPENKTTIIIIDNIYSLEPEILKKMLNVQQSDKFRNFRYSKDACSNIAKYDYLMLLKYYFMAKVEDICCLENIGGFVWIDFGFNHGGDYYLRSSDFDFEWKRKLKANIELFCLFNPNNITCIDSLQFQKDCMMGTLIGCKKGYAKRLWKWIREAMNALLLLECIDDDQQLLLMMYKAHKEECAITICDWFQPLELNTEHIFLIKKRITNSKNYDKSQLEDFKRRNQARIEEYYS